MVMFIIRRGRVVTLKVFYNIGRLMIWVRQYSSHYFLVRELISMVGHCWASTEINFSQISVPQGPTHIQASQIIMDFFDQFTKP